jgi:hypothetical protein
MLRTVFCLAIAHLGLGALRAQPAIEWQRTFGGTLDDTGASIAQTTDGGYILCGTTYSNNGNVSGNHGQGDIWVVKIDATGNLQWQRCLGGSQPDIGRNVLPLADGGYLVLGSTRSNDGDASGNHGMVDIWLVRLSAAGVPVSQRCYGGSLNDVPFGIRPTPDGGYIIAGESRSSDGDLTSNAGSTDYWVLKIGADQEIQWQRSYGGSSGDTAYAIELTTDGGYIMNGKSASNDGDVAGAPPFGSGSDNYWVVKLDELGNIQWQRPCGGSGTDLGFSVAQRIDGKYVAFGQSGSSDGDVTDPTGALDFWMIVLSESGVPVSAHSWGGSNDDGGAGLLNMQLGGLLLSGGSESNDGDVQVNFGGFDGWLVRTNDDGTIAWQLVLGGSNDDALGAMARTSDGGFVILGNSRSADGGVPSNQGGSDVWMVKLGSDQVGISDIRLANAPIIYPNPCHEQLIIAPAIQGKGPYRWRIIDHLGAVISSGTLINVLAPLPTGQLASGHYLLQFESEERFFTVPFVKE